MNDQTTGGNQLIRLENVSYSAADENGKVDILKNVTLEINERFVAITGPNGGGKSTLAKLIAGILVPTSGHIYYDDTEITNMSITERARMGISFAFQAPVKFKGITVRDMISIAAGKTLPLGVVCQYLSEVGLCARDYVDREVNGSLSGGELKRIEIAMIMARGTSFSIFDEPEAGIDLWSFQNLIRVFEKLHEKTAGSIVIISHQERILDIADRIIVIADGEVVADGEGKDILPAFMNGTITASCKKIEEA